MASHRLAPVAFPLSPFPSLVIRPIGPIAPIGLIPPHMLPYPQLLATLSYTYSYLSSELPTAPSRV